MNIALLSDNINFPSLPLMKISAWHKAQGHTVTLVNSDFCLLPKFDICYVSKTFNLPLINKIDVLQYLPAADRYILGGSGFAIEIINGKEIYNKTSDIDLPLEIEQIYPDYNLYPEFKAAYGFLTRGCPKGCGFCIVKNKEGLCSNKVADLKDFWHGQKEIVLLDPNLLACKDKENLLKQLIDSNALIDYTQGLDAMFVDNHIAKMINATKIKMIHFAFDSMKNEAAIIKGLKTFNKHSSARNREKKVYILTNFDTTHEEDLYRVRKVTELDYTPHIMIYQKGTHPQFLTDLQQWANNPISFRSCKFEDFAPRVDGKTMRELYKL